jgi:hypothetical protein
MNLEKYIAELLSEHDCVIIPGFGGFIGNYTHARVHPVHHTFFPPYKKLLFNINLKQNDGLLATRISFHEGISYERAMDEISGKVEGWMHQLREHKVLQIDPIGKLTRSREGNIQFEQDQALNFLPDSYGLASFVSPAIRRIGVQEKIGKKISRYMEAPTERKRILPKTLKWAAVLALPIGIAAYMGISNFSTIRNLRIDYTGWFYSSPAPESTKSTVPPKTLAIHISPPAVKEKKSSVSQEVRSTPAPAPVTETVKAEPQPASQPFAVIVGAFKVRENADNLVSNLRVKGFDALILDTTKTGLFRVSIGTYSTRDKALEQLASVRSKEFSSAWLLSR